MNKQQIRQMIERFNHNRMSVLKNTQLTGDRLNIMIFEYGMKYLEHECQGDDEGVKMMSRTGLFWRWWQNLWSQRDAKLLQEYSSFDLRFYQHWHDVTSISQHPHRFIYERAYDEMIQSQIQKSHDTSTI